MPAQEKQNETAKALWREIFSGRKGVDLLELEIPFL